MSVLVLVEFNVKPENIGDLMNFMKAELHHTRGFDGCNGLTLHRNQDDSNNMVFIENWDSRQHYEKVLAWRTERGDFEKLFQWLAGEPSFRYFDIVGVQLPLIFNRQLLRISSVDKGVSGLPGRA